MKMDCEKRKSFKNFLLLNTVNVTKKKEKKNLIFRKKKEKIIIIKTMVVE